MKITFIDIILFVLFFQLLSLFPFFLFQKRPGSYSNQIFALFLFSKAMCISSFICFRLQPYSTEYVPHLFFIGSSFTILWGPILYFYVKSLTHKNFRFKKKDIWHALPFLLHFFYLTFRFHLHTAETKRMLISSNSVFPYNLSLYIEIFIHVYILIYTIASFRMIMNYRSAIKDTLSSIEKVQLSWLIFVLSGFFVKYTFDMWYSIGFMVTQKFLLLPLVLSRIALFLFLNIMIFKVLRQPQLFCGIEDGKNGKRFSLSKAVSKQYIAKLSAFMDKSKPYLDPDITLYDLAKQVNIPARSLSEVINCHLGKNFYEFINSYRIKESQKMLTDPSTYQRTVLEILYEVGFNNKSVFNNTFKKSTGMTPSQFRQLKLQSQLNN
jgi:AraC-like DNA-binding protein